jgi:hypothetical protein
MFSPKEQQLARDIATALNDPHAFGLYLGYAVAIPHETLQSILAKVLSIPEEKIKRNRAALFTHLVEQYKEHGNPRH